MPNNEDDGSGAMVGLPPNKSSKDGAEAAGALPKAGSDVCVGVCVVDIVCGGGGGAMAFKGGGVGKLIAGGATAAAAEAS